MPIHLTPPFLRRILGPALCVLLAVTAAIWSYGSYQSVLAYRSPLKDQPPQPGPALGKPAPRQLVFVLIDGLRYDTAQETQVMPNLSRLRQVGAFARMNSRPPSYSQPGYTTLLTGAWPDFNDGPAVNVDKAQIWTFTQDNLFSAAKRAGLSSAISGYDWFEKLVPQDALSASFYTPGEDNSADLAVVDAALPWLQEAKYNLVLIHIDQVDYAGHHEGGPRSPAWFQAAARADSLLGEILDAVDLKQDAVLICSDHGHIDRGGHGGQDAVTLVEPFVLAGKGVRPGLSGDVRMIDVAPTLAALLGTNLPASAEGRPVLEMLDLGDGQEAQLKEARDRQYQGLANAYLGAVGVPAGLQMNERDLRSLTIDDIRGWRLNKERSQRLWPLVVLVLLSGGLLLWRRPRGWGWLACGALLAVAVFHFYYALIEGRTYSLSSVDSLEQLALTVTIGSLLSFLVGLLPPLFGPRLLGKPAPGPFSLLNYLIALLYLLVLPPIWSIYLNGWTATWTLPDFSSAFYGLITGFQLVLSAFWGGITALGLAIQAKVGPRKVS